jgi:hypothetical protein
MNDRVVQMAEEFADRMIAAGRTVVFVYPSTPLLVRKVLRKKGLEVMEVSE